MVEPVVEDLVPVARDDLRRTTRAERGVPIDVVDVARVHVAKAVAHRDLACAGEGGARGGGGVQHLPVGVERAEVQWDVRAAVLEDPGGHAVQFSVGVVVPRHDQRRQLDPRRALLHRPFDALQHVAEMATADLAVVLLGETFEVDVDGIHGVEQFRARAGFDITSGDADGLDPPRAARVRGIDGVLQEDHGIVVGERHTRAAEPLRGLRDLLGAGLVCQGVDVAGLGDVPVLAELARQVASRGPEAEHGGTGQEVVEWLLLDRVDAVAAGPAVGGTDDRIVLPGPHEAQAALSLVQPAGSRADVTLHPTVVEGVPVQRLVRPHDYSALLPGGIVKRWLSAGGRRSANRGRAGRRPAASPRRRRAAARTCRAPPRPRCNPHRRSR